MNGKYQAWGIGNGYKRPLRRNFCGAGNFSETVQSVWGWAEAECSTPLIFISETKRGFSDPEHATTSRVAECSC